MRHRLTFVLGPLLLVACSSSPSRTASSGGDGQLGGDHGGAQAAEDAGSSVQPHRDPRKDGGSDDDVDAGPCTEVVDVVLALDVSSSMGFVLEDLQSNIAGVVDAANMLAPDAHFGLIPFVDNYAIDATGPLEGGKVHTSAATLESAFADIRDTYTTPNRNPGDGPSGPTTQNPICEENAVDALYGAATDFPWRDNATRVIIIATDDTFLDAPDNYGDRDADGKTDKTDYPREGDYPAKHSLADTVKALQDARIRVFSFARKGYMKDDLTAAFEGPCGCGTSCRFGDSTHLGDGWYVPYKGAKPIPEATDGKNFDLQQVQSGSLSLAETIKNVVVESYCVPPVL